MADIQDSTTDSDGSFRRPTVQFTAVVVTVLCGGVVLAAVGVSPTVLPDNPETPGAAVSDVSGNVTVTYETAAQGAGEFGTDPVDPDLVADEWAFIDRSVVPPALDDVPPDAGVIPVGEMALVGSVDTDSRPVGNATVTIVVPSGRDVDPARKTQFISEYVSPYALGPAETDVTLVAAPDVLPYRGAMYANGTGYVTRTAFWDGDVESVWIHEFLHARQQFSLSPDMQWFSEASAEYLSYRIMQEQYDAVTNEDVQARLDAAPAYPDATLADDSTWTSADVQYTRGVRLLYRIDGAIRAESNGERTIFDVFRTMNERDEQISLGSFVRIVDSQTGADDARIRSAVTGTGPIGEYLAVEHSAFESSADTR